MYMSALRSLLPFSATIHLVTCTLTRPSVHGMEGGIQQSTVLAKDTLNPATHDKIPVYSY